MLWWGKEAIWKQQQNEQWSQGKQQPALNTSPTLVTSTQEGLSAYGTESVEESQAGQMTWPSHGKQGSWKTGGHCYRLFTQKHLLGCHADISSYNYKKGLASTSHKSKGLFHHFCHVTRFAASPLPETFQSVFGSCCASAVVTLSGERIADQVFDRVQSKKECISQESKGIKLSWRKRDALGSGWGIHWYTYTSAIHIMFILHLGESINGTARVLELPAYCH